MRRRFILLDVGAYPGKRVSLVWIFGAVARLADHVSYRDIRSRQAMTGLGDSYHGTGVYPDLAFAHPEILKLKRAYSRTGLMVIGVIDDGILANRGWPEDYIRILGGVAIHALDRGMKVSVVVGDVADEKIAHKLVREVQSIYGDGTSLGVEIASDFVGLLRTLAEAELVVASRYHNLIAAIGLGIPVVAAGYAVKCRDLLEAAGVGEYALWMEGVTSPSAVSLVHRALELDTELASTIRKATAAYPHKVDKLLCDVLGTAESLPCPSPFR